MKQVKTYLDIGCSCGNEELHTPKVVRDEEDKIFLIALCRKCKNIVALELNSLIAALYDTTLPKTKGNGKTQ